MAVKISIPETCPKCGERHARLHKGYVHWPLCRCARQPPIPCPPRLVRECEVIFVPDPNAPYDSTNDTIDHIDSVRAKIDNVRELLRKRAMAHDRSKLESPEKEVFDTVTGRLKASTYGSDEYKATLAEMKPALDHHYAANSHHPEHYRWHCPICNWQGNDAAWEKSPQGPNDSGVRYCPQCHDCAGGLIYETELMLKPELGISGMSLLDLVEMFCDWKAATERHADGSLERSIKINTERFKLSPQLASILENTQKELGW